MKELRPHLDLDTYLSLLDEMRPQGYRLFALEEDGHAWPWRRGGGANFYNGRYLFIYDLVTRGGAIQRIRGQTGPLPRDVCPGSGLSSGGADIGGSSGRMPTASMRKMGYARNSWVFRKGLSP